MAKKETMALVGSGSLLGRELRDIFSSTILPVQLKLIASDEDEAGTLTEQGGEPALINLLTAQSLGEAKIAFLAGTPASARRVYEAGSKVALIDLTDTAEELPNARLRAPFVEPEDYRIPPNTVHVIAHPAAIAIALLLERLQETSPVQSSIAHVFEPAGERGIQGVTELQQQSVSLLSFKSLPKAIFDTQLAFNMLARYGEEAPTALETIELRIERHLATLLSLSRRVPMPSLRLIQAPVFHGYSFSIWVEFERNPGVEALEQVLAREPIDLRASDTEPPSTAGIAGHGGVAVGRITIDRNNPQACWLWMVADNLRLMAENAVLVARQLMGS